MAWREDKNRAGGTQSMRNTGKRSTCLRVSLPFTVASVNAIRHQRSPRFSSAQSAEPEGYRKWIRDRRITLALGCS